MRHEEDCSRYEILLSAYLDDQLTPESVWLVQGHLQACPACAELLMRLMSTARAFHSIPRPIPQTDPWEGIVFTLRRERLVTPRWSRRTRPWGIAMAAVLVAIWGYSALRPAPQSAPLQAYWREHAIFTSQEEPAVSNGAPSIDAIEATYQLQGDLR